MEFRCIVEYKAVEAVFQAYRSTCDKSTVLEFRCTSSRTRPAFFHVFYSILEQLVASAVIDAAAAAQFARPVLKRRPAAPALPPSPVTVATLSPLHAMIMSMCSTSRREGLAVLASLCARASADSQLAMVQCGTLALLKSTAPAVQHDYEASFNVNAIIARLEAVAVC